MAFVFCGALRVYSAEGANSGESASIHSFLASSHISK